MNARTLAKKNLDDITFSVVDLETTGMHAQFNRVVDIGVVTVRNGKVLDEWEALVDPEQDIPYWITKYTNLRNRDVQGQPIFANFAPKLEDMLRDTVFVAHNVNFDYWFMYFEMKREGIKFNFPRLCTVMLGRKLLHELPSANLDSLSDYYGIEIENRHRALPDAQATAEILINFIEIAKEKYSAKTFFDLERLQWLKVGTTNFSNSPGLFDEA